MLRIDVRFGGVIVERLDEEVFVRVLFAAVPVEEDAAFLGTGGVCELSHLLAEVLDVFGRGAEANVDENHACWPLASSMSLSMSSSLICSIRESSCLPLRRPAWRNTS